MKVWLFVAIDAKFQCNQTQSSSLTFMKGKGGQVGSKFTKFSKIDIARVNLVLYQSTFTVSTGIYTGSRNNPLGISLYMLPIGKFPPKIWGKDHDLTSKKSKKERHPQARNSSSF